MTSLKSRRAAVVALVSIGLLSAWGCSSSTRISYIPDGGAYTADDLGEVIDSTDPGDTRGLPADEVGASRQEALANLRTHGQEAGALADALTHQFPVDVNAVPIEVRSATYEGAPVWIVVESWGDAGQALSSLRLWVFSANDLTLVTAVSGN